MEELVRIGESSIIRNVIKLLRNRNLILILAFGKALIVWIFNLIAAGLAFLLASMIMASSLLMSHGI